MLKRFLVAIAAGCVSVTGGVVFAQSGSAGPVPPTFGRMPADLVVNGQVDLARVPDFISTVDAAGNVVGYVRSDELMPVAPNGDLLEPSTSQTVFARDGKTVVGRMDAGIGFTAADAAKSTRTGSPPTTIHE